MNDLSAVCVAPCEPHETLSLRTRFRREMNCQIVHDSIHTRRGWTRTYLLFLKDALAGFGTIATGGPWKEKPALLEFYLLPEFRWRAFALFEAFLSTAKPQFLEVQTNDTLAFAMAFTYGEAIETESIVFADGAATSITVNGATLVPATAESEFRQAIQERQGGGEWNIELDGKAIGKGGLLFHYNIPYGDIYMEIDEPYRRRGLGSYLVQELKKIAYSYGAIPAARCNPQNTASRRTLQRAGFVPYAHIVNGRIRV